MTDREIRRTLAEKLFGWTYWDGGSDYEGPAGLTIFTDWGLEDLGRVDVYENSDDVTRTFNPFEWEGAGMVLEALAKKLDEDWGIRLEMMGDSAYVCIFGRYDNPDPEDGPYKAIGPRAISLAAYQWSMGK